MAIPPIEIVNGASYPFRAVGLLRRTPSLWGYVVVPIVVNVVVGVTVYAALLIAGLRIIDTLIGVLPEWLAILGFFLRVLLIVALLVVTGFVLARFGVLLGSPWYSRLSERLEQMRTGKPMPTSSSGIVGVADDLRRALSHELKKLSLVGGVGLLLFLTNVIPVAGTIVASVGGIALGMTVACLDFLDAPLERRRLTFRQKLGVIRGGMPATAGFGLACLALVSIPLLNLIFIPICVTAGTLFYCDRVQDTGIASLEKRSKIAEP
jgi:CysZ protein